MTTTGPKNSPLLTPAEAAEYCRVSAKTLERYRREGTGPRFVCAGRGRKVLYRGVDLDRWIEAQLRSSTAEVAL